MFCCLCKSRIWGEDLKSEKIYKPPPTVASAAVRSKMVVMLLLIICLLLLPMCVKVLCWVLIL